MRGLKTRGGRISVTLIGAAALAVGLIGVAAPASSARPAAAASGEAVLNGVTCQTLTQCWAVGYVGANPSSGSTLAERWNNTHHKWVRVTTANPHGVAETSFNGVACISATSCMAVGTSETASAPFKIAAVAEHWNGQRWKLTSVPHPAGHSQTNLQAVSCPEHGLCIAVGSYVTNAHEDDSHILVEQWNGSRWRVVHAPGTFDSSVFNSISCASATSCLAVGADIRSAEGFPLTESWDGRSWSVVTPRLFDSEDMRLAGVSCATSTSCLAVGDYQQATGFTGDRPLAETWTAPAAAALNKPNRAAGRADDLWSVSCPSATDCIAVGQSANPGETRMTTLAERWNGSRWTTMSTPSVAGGTSYRFLGISCVSTTDCFAVGDNETHAPFITTVTERWNGQHWHHVS